MRLSVALAVAPFVVGACTHQFETGTGDAWDAQGTDGTQSSGVVSSSEAGERPDLEDASEADGADAPAPPPFPSDEPGSERFLTEPSLWYAVGNQLTYIKLDPNNGSVEDLVTSNIVTPLYTGQTGITMLTDGSLLGSRQDMTGTQIFHVIDPPSEQGDVEVDIIGLVPNGLIIEALYTDCQGRVYLMDTGNDVNSAVGNRLLRFTGDYLSGDLSYDAITDFGLTTADIDDLGPGINSHGEITDGTGFAIDTGEVYRFDYNTGFGEMLGHGGTWGIHAVGGSLFADGVARLYLLDSAARLFEANPEDLQLSPILAAGPSAKGGVPDGWSGLAGPLTECLTTLSPQ